MVPNLGVTATSHRGRLEILCTYLFVKYTYCATKIKIRTNYIYRNNQLSLDCTLYIGNSDNPGDIEILSQTVTLSNNRNYH